MVEFGRVLTAMVTPLNEEGGIDYETAGKWPGGW